MVFCFFIDGEEEEEEIDGEWGRGRVTHGIGNVKELSVVGHLVGLVFWFWGLKKGEER